MDLVLVLQIIAVVLIVLSALHVNHEKVHFGWLGVALLIIVQLFL